MYLYILMPRSLESDFVIAVCVLRGWMIGPVVTTSTGEECSLTLLPGAWPCCEVESGNMVLSVIVFTSQAGDSEQGVSVESILLLKAYPFLCGRDCNTTLFHSTVVIGCWHQKVSQRDGLPFFSPYGTYSHSLKCSLRTVPFTYVFFPKHLDLYVECVSPNMRWWLNGHPSICVYFHNESSVNCCETSWSQ